MEQQHPLRVEKGKRGGEGIFSQPKKTQKRARSKSAGRTFSKLETTSMMRAVASAASMKPPPPPMARTKAAGESTGRAAASMTGALSGCRTATE
jgi:hypothetical protein